jgi:hypothetical protein
MKIVLREIGTLRFVVIRSTTEEGKKQLALIRPFVLWNVVVRKKENIFKHILRRKRILRHHFHLEFVYLEKMYLEKTNVLGTSVL